MGKSNKNITFKGNKISVTGKEVKEGDKLPDFKVTANNMSDLSYEAYKGKPLIISVVPSIDTPVCSIQTKHFNMDADSLEGAANILTISRDLPFAQTRWCGAEGIKSVVTASDYKYRTFGENFGVELPDLGLLARAIFVANKEGVVTYVEYVDEVTSEPNYDAALDAVRKTL